MKRIGDFPMRPPQAEIERLEIRIRQVEAENARLRSALREVADSNYPIAELAERALGPKS